MTPEPAAAPPTLDALQAVLAGEHACVYGYGLLGPFAAPGDEAAVRTAYDWHRAARDELSVQVRARSADPVAALPGYAVPFPVADRTAARRLAGLLERRLAPLYADLVAAAANRTLREWTAQALMQTAVRAAHWTADTPALPGLDPPS
ncbi:MAG: ferritin-like domain-containing protein [Jiangellaceae bacterium]|nr:ferritin-like domain-containing protein [Jiangellaceae bacterium]